MSTIFSHETPMLANRRNPGKIVSKAPGADPREAAWAKGARPRPMNEGRSRNMKANRRADTKPEIALRRALHHLGYRYRKDYRIDLAEKHTCPAGHRVHSPQSCGIR